MKKLIIVFCLMLILSACATPYQSGNIINMSWGYKDEKLADNLYVVSFAGNVNTARAAVEKMFLRRCAELTKQNGYKYFFIAGINEDDKRRMADIINKGEYQAYFAIQTQKYPPGTYTYFTNAIIRMTNKQSDETINAEVFLRSFATNN